jgi:hypothetical protein
MGVMPFPTKALFLLVYVYSVMYNSAIPQARGITWRK